MDGLAYTSVGQEIRPAFFNNTLQHMPTHSKKHLLSAVMCYVYWLKLESGPLFRFSLVGPRYLSQTMVKMYRGQMIRIRPHSDRCFQPYCVHEAFVLESASTPSCLRSANRGRCSGCMRTATCQIWQPCRSRCKFQKAHSTSGPCFCMTVKFWSATVSVQPLGLHPLPCAAFMQLTDSHAETVQMPGPIWTSPYARHVYTIRICISNMRQKSGVIKSSNIEIVYSIRIDKHLECKCQKVYNYHCTNDSLRNTKPGPNKSMKKVIMNNEKQC